MAWDFIRKWAADPGVVKAVWYGLQKTIQLPEKTKVLGLTQVQPRLRAQHPPEGPGWEDGRGTRSEELFCSMG
jgi:hypothetical protein